MINASTTVASVIPVNGKNQTRFGYVTGETSSYISSTNVLPTGAVQLRGVRFSTFSNDVYVDGAYRFSAKTKTNLVSFYPSDYGVGAGWHSAYISNTKGQSNIVSFNVVSSTTNATPSITSVEVPTLKLVYDNNSKESALIANYSVTVQTGTLPLVIDRNTQFAAQITGGNPAYSTSAETKIIYVNKQDFTGSTTIPSNSSANFYVQQSFSPKALYAGTYVGKFNGIYAPGIFNAIVAPYNQTNAVTIIGETAPYITSITTGTALSTSTLTISGVRFNPGPLSVVVGGVNIGSWAPNSDGNSVKVYLQPGISGNVPVQVSNVNGASNMMYVQVTPIDPNIGCANGAYFNFITGALCNTSGTTTLTTSPNWRSVSANANIGPLDQNGNTSFVAVNFTLRVTPIGGNMVLPVVNDFTTALFYGKTLVTNIATSSVTVVDPAGNQVLNGPLFQNESYVITVTGIATANSLPSGGSILVGKLLTLKSTVGGATAITYGNDVYVTNAIQVQTANVSSYAKEDVNKDGVVDQKDVDYVKSQMGLANFDPAADVNGDGKVTISDLAAVKAKISAGMVQGAFTSCITLTQPLHRGSTDALTHGEVSLLQSFIEAQGFAVGNRGVFDTKTESAVSNWQHSQALISTGKVGAVSRAAIQKISCTRV
jgi:hypothetical protein